MAKTFLTSIDLAGNELQNAVIQNLATLPIGKKGQIAFHTASGVNRLAVHNGTAWETLQTFIAAGTTAQYYRGDKSWQTLNTDAVTESSGHLYYTDARVKAYADTLYLPITGTAAAATKLATARAFSIIGGATAAAVNFDGTTNVALNVTALDANKLGGTIPSTVLGNSTLYLGTTAIKLNQASNTVVNVTGLNSVNIGSAVLKYDAENNALYVEKSDGTAVNFYATGELSAYGAGSGTGGGTGVTALSALTDVSLTTPANGNVLVYNGTHWVNLPQSAITPDLTAYATKNYVDTEISTHTHTFASITDKPTTLAGYGITDAANISHNHAGVYEPVFTKNTAFNKNFGTAAGTVSEGNHTHTFASLTSKPTTLAGYGITDAASSNHTHAYLPLSGGTVTGGTTFANILRTNSVLSLSGLSFWNVVNYSLTGTSTIIRINTRIPYTSLALMPTVHLSGYAYGQAAPIDLKVSWYIYNGNYIKVGATCSGAWKPTIYLTNEGGYCSINLVDSIYYPRFTIDFFDNWGGADRTGWATGWTVESITTLGTVNRILVPYRDAYLSADTTGNAATATKLQTARTINGVAFDGTADIAIPFANLSSKPTTLSGYGITDAAISFGNRTNTATTTIDFITQLANWGMFNYGHSFCKFSWSYAGNADLTDTGFGTIETAGAICETWQNGDGTKMLRLICPNTGAGAYQELIYNDQGSGYSPGWRKVWNSRTLVNISQLVNDVGYITASASITGNAATATVATKLGTTTVGSTVTPFYLNAGVPTAFATTVGSATLPVYINAGSITACTSFGGLTGIGTATPLMDGTAAVGTSTLSARQDHRHPTDTSRAATNQTMYIGTTAVTINRASATLNLTGIGSLAMGGALTGATTMAASVSVTTPKVIFAAAGWSVEQSGTEIQFKYNGTIKQRLLNDGSIVATGELTAFGSAT